jgi:hypothetical protein
MTGMLSVVGMEEQKIRRPKAANAATELAPIFRHRPKAAARRVVKRPLALI